MHKAVYTYWVDNLKWRASFDSSLEFLCVSGYWPSKKHPLIQNIGCVSDVPRVHTKLKLVTGTYILQVNRVRFNQNEIDATCQICHQAEETLEHFILDCTVLEPVRRPALDAILRIAYELLDRMLERDQLLQLILDSSFFFSGSDATLRQTSYRAEIHLQFWADESWDSLFPISMSPNCKLMSPKHYFNDKSAILLHPGTRWDSLK